MSNQSVQQIEGLETGERYAVKKNLQGYKKTVAGGD